MKNKVRKNPRKDLLVSLVLLVAFQVQFSGKPLAEDSEKETLKIAGLTDSVEIILDQWGIPHIYANSQSDLFFAQGFNAARDRLFQFELWRRRALGMLAEIQGEKALEHDISARLFKFRGNIDQELAYYHNDSDEIIRSFVSGVNAYIRLSRKHPEQLPIEFRLLGIEPGFWTPEVVVSRHNALTGSGAGQEHMIAKLITSIGDEKTKQLLSFSHEPSLHTKGGINLADINDEVLKTYRAYRSPPSFEKEDLNKAVDSDSSPVSTLIDINALLQPLKEINSIGSNNWLIAGSKTASGYPIMANDPHRKLEIPSLRYWAHLVAPGWNVIGGGEPILPGISIGHNEYGAWGLTRFTIDQEDLYVYDINPENHNQYRYNGRWESMELVHEEIAIKGQPARQVTLKYTRHGPVLHEDPLNHKAYGLRAAWLDVGAAPYLASLRINQAKDWSQFREACSYFGLPAENMIWADKKGNIGWQAVGFTPIRLGWEGLLPIPGDGRYEWGGYAPIRSLPHRLNPAIGYWASANQNNVPEGYPNIFSFLAAPPFRFDRINEVLEKGVDLTIKDSMTLQHDVHSMVARKLVPLLSKVEMKFSSITVKHATQRLLKWDYELKKGSVEATIYTHWEKELSKRLAVRFNTPFVPIEKLVDWLHAPDTVPAVFSGSFSYTERDQLLIDAMAATVDVLSTSVSSNINAWKYGQGKLARSNLVHPLSALVDKERSRVLDVGPIVRGGDGNTINLNAGEGNHLYGAGFRIITDVSDWDLAKGTVFRGQSGDPDNPHYNDWLDAWLNKDYFPVYYSKKKIRSVAKKITLLEPSH